MNFFRRSSSRETHPYVYYFLGGTIGFEGLNHMWKNLCVENSIHELVKASCLIHHESTSPEGGILSGYDFPKVTAYVFSFWPRKTRRTIFCPG